MLPLATTASGLWGFNLATITLVAQRENTTFKVTTTQNHHYALRIHRPGYRELPQLQAELQWIQHLFAQGLAVPAPVASLHGRLVEQQDGYCVSVLQWLAGQPMGQAGVPLQLHQPEQVLYTLGQGMAELHTASDNWTGSRRLARPSWDIDGLVGETPVWGAFWQNPLLTSRQKQLFETTRLEIKNSLMQCGQDLNYGLIHADLVRENIMLHQHQLQFIDFDDSGFGFRLFELATCLLANANEPDYETLKTQLIAGYHSVRPLDVTHLQLFIMLRALTYVGWVVPRLHEQGGPARCQRFIQRAELLCEQYDRTKH